MSGPSHSSTLGPRAGFHPTLRTTVTGLKPLGIKKEGSTSTSTSNATSSCSLHLLYSLSPSIILDQYQLRQLHNEGRLVTSQRSANVEAGEERKPGRPISAELYLGGQLDLEAPVSTIDPSLNAYAILSIPLTAPTQQNTPQLPEGYEMPAVDVDVDLPLHLRYQEPVLSRWLSKKGREGYGGGWWTKRPQPDERQDIVDVEVAWPCVFWACETEQPEAEAGKPEPTFILDLLTLRYTNSRITLPQDGQLIVLHRPSPRGAPFLSSQRLSLPPINHSLAPLSPSPHVRFRIIISIDKSSRQLIRLCPYGCIRGSVARKLDEPGCYVAGVRSYRLDYDEGSSKVGQRDCSCKS